MGRVKYATKNIIFGYISNIITMLLAFALRRVFVVRLDETLYGVNTYYTDILSALSMAELGIGTAINFSLYAPVARGDIGKIKAYMQFYKGAYRVIAVVVAGIGLALVPFLPHLITDPGSNTWADLRNYYLIFLFNTVTSYLVSYKYSLPNAQQKGYIQTNVITVTKIITSLIQMAVIIFTSNFYFYLLTQAAIELGQKVIANAYLNHKYPYLIEGKGEKLTPEETAEIKKKTGALICHKVGDTARLQTDSLIIAKFINVTMPGIVGNYNYVITSVSNFVSIIFNSVISSFGNLIVTESKEKQYQMFQVYRFFACWLYGFSAVGFYLLLSPLIRLWMVDSMWILPEIVVACILIDYYFKGERVVLSNYKTAAGVFEQDKFLPLAQGGVNLVLSILLVRKIGLAGIYIGTIVSGLMANVIRPFIIYDVCFGKKAAGYFVDSAKYVLVTLAALAVCKGLSFYLLKEITVLSFAGCAVMTGIVFNGIFLAFFGRTRECRYLFGLLKGKIGRIERKGQG